MAWFKRHAEAIGAIGTILMALSAFAAAILVPLQIAASDRTSREQAAREIYREFLNITIQRPELAASQSCPATDPLRQRAYQAYVDYLLYTAEQVLDLSPEDWRDTVAAQLAPHRAYLCGFDTGDMVAMTVQVADLVAALQTDCEMVTTDCL
ncbi:MAG: hypothetical protein ACMUJJ_14200 [Roseicyclus sp.]|uniref:hypothetical protein n=1 Tax=Roseicyclus sp. TaxID=1914329 RepID=UPI003A8B9BDA